jgi:hypothetical protein
MYEAPAARTGLPLRTEAGSRRGLNTTFPVFPVSRLERRMNGTRDGSLKTPSCLKPGPPEAPRCTVHVSYLP